MLIGRRWGVCAGAWQGEGGGCFSLLAAAGLPALPGRGGPEHRSAARVMAGVRIAVSRRREERSGRTAHVLLGGVRDAFGLWTR